MKGLAFSIHLARSASVREMNFIPFFSALSIFLPKYLSYNIFIFSGSLFFFLSLCLITVYGILTLQLQLRKYGTFIFSLGIVFGFLDPMMLAFGVVLTWLFYELWYILARFNQLNKDYFSYPARSIEKYRLYKNFKNRVISILLLAWFTLSLSWAVLVISSTFYFELGETFGTMGLATSTVMIVLVLLSRKLVLTPSTKQKSEN